MESTSDNEPSSFKRRFSDDNPFCDPSDTDESYEVPAKKIKQIHSHPKPQDQKPTRNSTDQPGGTITITNQSVNTGLPITMPDGLPITMPDATQPSDIGPSNNEIIFNGAFDDFNLHSDERNNLLADLKKVMTRFQRGDSDIEGINEINKTLQDLKPLKDVIYCYVRFARQLPVSSFNTDSLCSLLCLAKQCNVKPFVFLTKIKTLEVHNNQYKYGVSFSFVTRNTQDFDGVLLEKKFLGLKYTLKLLQSTVTKSETSLHQMAKLPRIQATSNHPTLPTKKQVSLYAKLWRGITHRWIAYHVVNHLFSLNKASSLTNQQIFILSTQILATCGRSRYDFLTPLVGVCLHFNKQVDIDDNQQQLSPIQANPSLFHSFGTTCLRDKPKELLVQCIQDTFSNLKKIIQRKSMYRSLAIEAKWLLLKAYTYHLWLEQANNDSIKKLILTRLSQERKPTLSQNADKVSGTISLQKSPATCKTSLKSPPPATTVNTTKFKARLSSAQQEPTIVNRGLERLLESRQKLTESSQPETQVEVPTTRPSTTYNLEVIAHTNCDWNSFRLLSTCEMDRFLASYLIIRREDGIDIVSRLSAFEIYSANNLHKLSHCRLNGNSDFYPTGSVGQVVLNIGNKINQFVDVSSKIFHIAREGSIMFREHGKSLPDIKDIATLCRAVLVHGSCDQKRCPSQRRAFIGNGGLDFPNGIPTTIVDGGFRKKLNNDPTFCQDQVQTTIGSLSEFLWRTMVHIQECANDSPLAPDRFRHSAYSKHLCTLLSMADCVSFENITLVVSLIYPTTTSDVSEHIDVMNDSVPGYTRTGTLSMCFMVEGTTKNTKLGIKLQVIGDFRRVIRQFLERKNDSNKQTNTLSPYVPSPVIYQRADHKLKEAAYNFGKCLRAKEIPKPIIFHGRHSRRSDGARSYSNSYTHSKITYSPYRFKVATFCDKRYAAEKGIQHIKVLGHMEPPQNVHTQVNCFRDYESGKTLLEYMGKMYGINHNLDAMRSASYHQQAMNETQSEWTVFEGHIDKNFVHTVWFIPLTGGTFYTLIAVPQSWNMNRHDESERKFQEWMASMADNDQKRLRNFKGTFDQEAKGFMNTSSIQVLVYYCTVGSFLSFPANVCYHATVSIQCQDWKAHDQMKDLLIVYPMESG